MIIIQSDSSVRVKRFCCTDDEIHPFRLSLMKERCVWYIVKTAEGEELGTLVLQAYHLRRSFFMPRAPRLLALEVTDRETIIAALSGVGENRYQ